MIASLETPSSSTSARPSASVAVVMLVAHVVMCFSSSLRPTDGGRRAIVGQLYGSTASRTPSPKSWKQATATITKTAGDQAARVLLEHVDALGVLQQHPPADRRLEHPDAPGTTASSRR